jgi:hypothetical protein
MKKILITIIVLVVLLVGGYWAYRFFLAPVAGAPAAGTSTPTLVQNYTNSTYHFSLKMPEGYEVQDLPSADGTGETIVLANTAGDGIQIVISPFDEDTGGGYTLTKERILQDVPDLEIQQEQPLDVGDNYHGLAFLSNNPSFGGASREVWFVYQGNLYQISTYARLDDTLKAIFATWQFN